MTMSQKLSGGASPIAGSWALLHSPERFGDKRTGSPQLSTASEDALRKRQAVAVRVAILVSVRTAMLGPVEYVRSLVHH